MEFRGSDEVKAQMWKALLDKCNELKRDQADWSGGSSRSVAYYGADGRSMQTTLDLSLNDGSHVVYVVEAQSYGYGEEFEISYKKYTHNAEDFWNDMLIRHKEQGDAVIVNGVHHTLGDENAKGGPSCRGYGGAKHVIRFFDGREVVSTNLWYQGTIPPVFRDLLPDNAEFIDRF